MTTLPAVPDVLRITWKQTFGLDTDLLNRAYFQYTGTPTDAVCASIAAQALSAWDTNILVHQSQHASLTEVQVSDLGGTGSFGTAPGTGVGSRTEQDMPAGTAFILKFIINRRYRGGKPKIFIGGLTAVAMSINPQTVDPSFAAALLDAWSTGLVPGITATYSGVTVSQQVNVSYFEGFTNFLERSGRYKAIPTPRVSPLVDPVVGYSYEQHFGSQRRRNLQST